MWKNFDQFFQEGTTLEYDASLELSSSELIISVLSLLLKVAQAGDVVHPYEIERAVQFISTEFDQSEEDIRSLVETANFLARDLTKLDSLVNRLHSDLTKGQKQEVVKGLWKVVKSDGVIEMNEAIVTAEIRKLLGLSMEEALHAQQALEAEEKSASKSVKDE